MEPQRKSIKYIYAIDGGDTHAFDITIHKQPAAPPTPVNAPEWTKLDFHRCENCSYTQSDHCPVALALVAPSATIGQMVSHQATTITVHTPERTYSKHTDVQEGLGSMLGLIMATSGCPSTAFFRPAAWFHLPFATFEETLYRIGGMWMLRQYFHDDKITNLHSIMEQMSPAYQDVNLVNKGIFNRLKAASITKMDAPFNAVTILSSFSMMIPFSIDTALDDIRDIFP